MTDEEQLAEWVAGHPKCPNDRGECCPDFSCCRPALLWPEAKRLAFRDAGDRVREGMLMGSLGTMLAGEGYEVTE